MESFWNDLYYSEIHLRDDWQFELQNDFFPNEKGENIATQEFYFFIPTSLQIDDQTYGKEGFYKDRINHIRYKTPEFSFEALLDKKDTRSPFVRINSIIDSNQVEANLLAIDDEIKLLGNIIRSSLRSSVRSIIDDVYVHKGYVVAAIDKKILKLCQNIQMVRYEYDAMQKSPSLNTHDEILKVLNHVSEFISNAVEYYCTNFLSILQERGYEGLSSVEENIIQLILQEREYQRDVIRLNHNPELALYHRGILNKFVLDALLLAWKRTSWVQKHTNLIASIAAGIAMFFYVIPFYVQGASLGQTSISFLVLTVFVYVLKDRMKEGLRTVFYKKACEWFSDYTTYIESPTGRIKLGKLQELAFFVDEEKVPQDVQNVRKKNSERDNFFSGEETVLYYKKVMSLTPNPRVIVSRRYKVSNIFLFNIRMLLEKARNSAEERLVFDEEENSIVKKVFPRVYHINIVIKSTYADEALRKKTKIKKIRLIVDKSGIKRIERVSEGFT